MISRVRRWASQRSSQANSIRASTQIHQGKGEEHDRGPGKHAGRATAMPVSIPSSHSPATAVAGSSEP